MGIAKAWNGLVHLFYPRLCEGCNRPLLDQEEVLCIGCEGYLPVTGFQLAPENETSLRLTGRFPFHSATSLAYFSEGNILQYLLHRLKYNNRQQLGSYFGEQLAKMLMTAGHKIEAVVAIPLHKKKEAARGFNQSALFAAAISRLLHIPFPEGVVERIKKTESQTSISKEGRIDNVRGAFRLKDKTALANKHVLLVDDVLTTGATIESCANELLKTEGLTLSIATVGIAV